MLEFYADGELGEMDANAFVVVLRELLRSVKDVQQTVAEPGTRVTWRLRRLQEGSADVAVRAEVSGSATSADDIEMRYVQAVDEATSSPHSDTALSPQAIERLIRVHERAARSGLGTVSVGLGPETRVPLDAQRTQVLRQRLSGLVVSIGSVTGELQNIHTSSDPWYGSVREDLHGSLVRCSFPRELLSDFSAAVQQRVTVRGRVRKTTRGRVADVRATAVNVLPQARPVSDAFGNGGALPWNTRGAL